MSAPNFVPICDVDVEIFQRVNENFDLLLALEEMTLEFTVWGP